MINAQPDYKTLYEESQKRLVEVEHKAQKEIRNLTQAEANAQQQIKSLVEAEGNARQQVRELEEKLHLALLEANTLRRKLFGVKSDNRVKKGSEGQLDLFTLGATGEDITKSEEELRKEVKEANQLQETSAEKRKRALRTASRMVLPQTLEREEVIIDPQGDLSNYAVIGEDVTEVLVLVPASFKVKRIVRRRWALKDHTDIESKGVIIAPIPSRTVKRGLFDESVLAYLLVSKYVDHLPLHRQMKIFQRAGMDIPASTLSDNTAAVCRALLPLYLALKRELLANLYLQADETTIKVLKSEKNGACHLGYYWAIHAPIDGLVLFEYQQGRDQQGPKVLLKGFSGVLQSDGYSVCATC
jgi:transposase